VVGDVSHVYCGETGFTEEGLIYSYGVLGVVDVIGSDVTSVR
jgi:hypothetical protein